MAKQRYINTKFWDDSYVSELDPIEKLLFIYILTNALTNISGIYEITIKRIAFDTGIDKDMVMKIIKRFEEHDKIKYENEWIAIKNFIKHQKQSDNPEDNVNKGIRSEINKAPIGLVEWVFNQADALEGPSTPLNYLNLNLNLNSNLNIKRFKKPTIEQLREYADEKQLDIDCERFHDHYETIGWVVGKSKTPMKDWKAAIRNWVRNANEWSRSDHEKELDKLVEKYA